MMTEELSRTWRDRCSSSSGGAPATVERVVRPGEKIHIRERYLRWADFEQSHCMNSTMKQYGGLHNAWGRNWEMNLRRKKIGKRVGDGGSLGVILVRRDRI